MSNQSHNDKSVASHIIVLATVNNNIEQTCIRTRRVCIGKAYANDLNTFLYLITIIFFPQQTRAVVFVIEFTLTKILQTKLRQNIN